MHGGIPVASGLRHQGGCYSKPNGISPQCRMSQPELNQSLITNCVDAVDRCRKPTIEHEEDLLSGPEDFGIRGPVACGQFKAIGDKLNCPASLLVNCRYSEELARTTKTLDSWGEPCSRSEVDEEFINRVSSNVGSSEGGCPRCHLKVHAVHKRFVKLSSRPESQVLVLSPCPHRRVRIARAQCRDQLRATRSNPLRGDWSTVQIHFVSRYAIGGEGPNQVLRPPVHCP